MAPIKVAYSPVYAHSLPAGHRFPMAKYELLGERLLHEGLVANDQLILAAEVDRQTALRTHDAGYYDRFVAGELTASEQRRIGFPLDEKLIHRELIITQGTLDCCRHALAHNSCALNVAGGTHHAFADRGEGFCMLNDFAVAINQLLHENAVQKVLVVDLDVHQGNGTAKLFEDNKNVFTFSMHGEKNYPFHKEKSDLDIGLPDGMGDEDYLALLSQHLPNLVLQHKPDLLCYLAGVDVLETDRYGKLTMTVEGCRRRDDFVLDLCKQAGIPVAVSMGGGYSPEVNLIVDAHYQTFASAAARWY